MEREQDSAAKHGSASGSFAAVGSVQLPCSYGPFVLTELLHGGGFGEVYKAHHARTDKWVAVKILNPRRRGDPVAVRRFELEIEIAAVLKHPNILPVIGHGSYEGVPYAAMPLVDTDLLHFLAGKPMEPKPAASIVRQIAEAVHALHAAGYLHRDIKPANILIDRAGLRPLVADFGLAKATESDLQLSRTDEVVGTEPYMPPEQADPHLGDYSPATDVYALGATLYQVLTGRTPFPRPDRAGRLIRTQIAWDRPVPPSVLNPAIHPDIERICLVCLQKSPHDRYPSAAAVAEDLKRFEAGKPIEACLPRLPKRFYRRCRRQPVTTSVVLGALLLAALGGIAARQFSTDAQNKGKLLAGAQGDRDAAITRKQFQEYVSDMKEAPRLWRAGDVEQLGLVLARHERETPDLRGFEWHYWQRVLQSAPRPMSQPFRADSICLSEDGRLLAAADHDRVALYDVSSGERTHVWSIAPRGKSPPEHFWQLPWRQRVSLSPDGRWVAAVAPGIDRVASEIARDNPGIDPDAWYGTLRVWSTETYAEQLAVVGDSRISGLSVSFSASNEIVIAGGRDNSWLSWNIADATFASFGGEDAGRPQQSPIVRGGGFPANKTVTNISALRNAITHTTLDGSTFSTPMKGDLPDQRGTRIQSQRNDHATALVSLNKGVLTLRGMDSRVRQAVGPVRRDLTSRQIETKAEPRCFAIDGHRFVTGDADHVVRLWSIDPNDITAKVTAEYRGATEPIVAVALGDGGIACVDQAGSIRTWPWRHESPECVRFPAADVSEADSQTSFTGPSGTLVASQSSPGSSVTFQRVGQGTIAELSTDGMALMNVTFSPDESQAAVSLMPPPTPRNARRQRAGRLPDARLVILNLVTRRERLETPSDRYAAAGAAFSSDARFLSIPNAADGIQIFDRDDTSGRTTCQGARYRFTQLSPTGRFLVAGGEHGSVVWDVANDRRVYSTGELVETATFDGDRRAVLVGQRPHLIDLTAGAEVPTLIADLPRALFAFSSDGRRLFVVEPLRLRVFAMDSDEGTLLLDVPSSGKPPQPPHIERVLNELSSSPPAAGDASGG